ncbi:MAG: hypothetical protein DMF89_13065 [Acidobacteria bacterium]|nr:MAG: hypothetical protein DMF89_13065 [Acidobacteriota bacterium]
MGPPSSSSWAATGCSIGCATPLRRRCEAPRAVTAVIELVNVTKIYRRYSGRHFATLKSALLQRSILRDLQPTEVFPALSDVSFAVPSGSTFGVIGRNGSGKSTALKLVAGITKATTGTVRVKGRISALIELGAGFHPEISGRENVFINGIMLGLSKREIEQRFDEIVDFLLVGHVHAAGICRSHPRGARGPARGRGPCRRRRRVHAQVPGQVRGIPAARTNDSARHPLARARGALL